MGQTLSVNGMIETVLDKENDLRNLIQCHMGYDTREVYDEVIETYENKMYLMKEDFEENRDEAEKYQDIIDDGRHNISNLIEYIETEENPDKKEILRRLKNIWFDLSY